MLHLGLAGLTLAGGGFLKTFLPGGRFGVRNSLPHPLHYHRFSLLKEKVPPLIVIEFASKNGKEEKDSSPPPEKGDYFARSHRECFAIVM